MNPKTSPAPDQPVAIDVRLPSACIWVWGILFVFLFAYSGWFVPFKFSEAVGSVTSWEPGTLLAQHARSWLGVILFMALLVAWATGWGAVAVGHLTPRKDLLGLMFVLGAGLWLLSVAVLATGLFSVEFVPFLFGGLLVWGMPSARWFVRMTGLSTERVDWWTRFLIMAVWCAVAMGLLAALPAMSDPVAIGERLDDVLSHRSIGTVTVLNPGELRGGGVGFVPMLHLFCLSVQTDIAVRMTDWLFGLMSMVAVCAVGTLLWSRYVGWMAAAFFYLQPMWHRVGLEPRGELATVLFAVMAYGCVLAWARQEDDEPDQRYLWMTALAAGMAVATSWAAVSVVAIPVMVSIGLKWVTMASEHRWRRLWRWPMFLVLMTVPVAPWVVYTVVFDPDASRLLAGRALTFEARGMVDVLGGAIRFSFTDPLATPVLLMTMPVTMLHRKLDPTVRAALWLSLLVYLGWLVGTDRSMTMLMAAGGLAAWIGAYGVERFCRRGLSRWLIHGPLAVMLALGLMKQATALIRPGNEPSGSVPYLLGQISRDTQLSQWNDENYGALAWINANVPGNARLMMVAETSPLYSRVSVMWALPAERHPMWSLLEGASSLTLTGRLADRGITHAYVDHAIVEKWRDQLGAEHRSSLETLEKFLRRHAKVIHKTDGVTIYAIDPP